MDPTLPFEWTASVRAAESARRRALEPLRRWMAGWRRRLMELALDQFTTASIDAMDLTHRELLERLVHLRLLEMTLCPSANGLARVISASPGVVLHRTFFQDAPRFFGGLVAAVDASAGGFPWLPRNTTGTPRHVLERIASSLDECMTSVSPTWCDQVVGYMHEQACSTSVPAEAVADAPMIRAPSARAAGVYYSPSWAVAHIVDAALDAWSLECGMDARLPMLLDPACGAGAFLCGALRALVERTRARSAGAARVGAEHESGGCDRIRPTLSEKTAILSGAIHGVDVDPISAHRARVALLLTLLDGEAGRWAADVDGLASKLPRLSRSIKSGNTLIERGPLALAFGAEFESSALDWAAEFPEVMKSGGFDVVVGNPPFVDAESMTRHAPRLRAYCSHRYASARGNWDLYCVFVERALELQRAGGVQSLLVPNKLASAEYARGLRRLMEQHEISRIEDLSTHHVFAADSYPIVFVLTKRGIGVGGACTPAAVESRGEPWLLCAAGPQDPTDLVKATAARIVGAREHYEALDEPHVSVRGGATVGEAYILLSELREARRGDEDALRVVNSGTIDRYVCRWGEIPMRYLKARFLRPCVRAASLGALMPRRLSQALAPKCIVAGLTRSLEVFPDVNGCYLAGKSTTILVPRVSGISVVYLTAVLNSRLLTEIYLLLYGGLRLSGDYVRVGPPQLRRLPLVVPRTPGERALAGELEALATQRMQQDAAIRTRRRQDSILPEARAMTPQVQDERVDEEIEELVETLYLGRLSSVNDARQFRSSGTAPSGT